MRPPRAYHAVVTGSEKRLLFFWLPPLGWAALIFVASATPVPPQLLLDMEGLPHWDKALHLLIYAELALLLLRALRGEQRWGVWRTAAGAFALAALFGATDEFHQWFTPGRSMEFWDWAADALGAAVVFLMPGKP